MTRRMAAARHAAYELLHSPEIETRTELWVRRIIAGLIALSVLMVMLETVQEIAQGYRELFHLVELVTVVIFTAEYLLRVWSSVEIRGFEHPVLGRLRYIASPYALIDLVAILPFFLPHVVEFDLIYLRALRLMRLLRVMKLGRYSASLTMLMRVWRSKREDIMVSLSVIVLILLLSSSLMYYLEHQAQPEAFPNIFASLWWGVATLTTVGYGDVYPVTVLGKLCAAVIALLGIGLVALPSGIIVAGFIDEMHAAKGGRVCPHCGEEIGG